jgi:hypothetical protein
LLFAPHTIPHTQELFRYSPHLGYGLSTGWDFFPWQDKSLSSVKKYCHSQEQKPQKEQKPEQTWDSPIQKVQNIQKPCQNTQSNGFTDLIHDPRRLI